MPWEVEYRHGLYLPQIDWWLDAPHRRNRAFVSHAHFDHLAPHDRIVCSETTARLMRARMPVRGLVEALPFGVPFSLGPGCTGTLHPAGHIFGSAQLLAESGHGRLLYTGDFKLRPGLSAEPCATPRADVLIMETTYGLPHYVLPPAARVLADIVHFCREALSAGAVPVLFGYSLGKSQEILSGLAGAGLPVMLHPQTLKLTRICAELGLPFPAHQPFDAGRVAGHVVIAPPQNRASPWMRRLPAVRTAMITGWAMDPGVNFRQQCDAAFPLSDHADFADLLRFVELVQPRRVLTLHGFARPFAATLRDLGIEAWAVGEDTQLDLGILRRPPTIRTEAVAEPPAGGSAPHDAPAGTGSFAAFARLVDEVRRVADRRDKIGRLAGFFAALDDTEAGLAAQFLAARPFGPGAGRRLQLGTAALKHAVLAVASATEDTYRLAYARHGGHAEAAEALLAGHTRPEETSLGDIDALFHALAAVAGPAGRIELVKQRLATLGGAEIRLLLSILLGDLRAGIDAATVAHALAEAHHLPAAEVEDAVQVSGDLAAVARLSRARRLSALELAPFQPVPFMLAAAATAPAPAAPAAGAWQVEDYVDGIRCQIHRRGDRVEILSRDLHTVTAAFPELEAELHGIDADYVLDGVITALRGDRPVGGSALLPRLGRSGPELFPQDDLTALLFAFDLLWCEGRLLTGLPLAERRRQLCALQPGALALSAGVPAAVLLAPVHSVAGPAEFQHALGTACRRGARGLVWKDPASAYAAGRRTPAWLKFPAR